MPPTIRAHARVLICSVLSSTYPLPPLALLPLALLQLALLSASFTPRPLALSSVGARSFGARSIGIRTICARCTVARCTVARCTVARSTPSCMLHMPSCMLRHAIPCVCDSVMRSYFTCCMLCLRAPRVGPSMRPSGTACDGVDGSIVCDPFCSCEYGYIRSVHVNDLARNLAISIIRKSALFY